MAKKEAASSTATGRTSTASKARSTKAESSAPPATGTHKNVAVPAPSEVKAAAVVREPSHQDIARRAFELFQARGGYEGGAINDWLRAEQELRAKHP